MGFETQEEAERWAENMEMAADRRKEERMLAGEEADKAFREWAVSNKAYADARGWLQELTAMAYKRGFMAARGFK